MLGPKISIIIPTYNRAHTLERAIKSVLNQTYKNYQLIVVDDGSIDNTNQIIANYPQVDYLKQNNQGVSSARNLGIKHAKGDWIALLDSDDEWLASKLELQVEYSLNHPQIELIHGEEIWIRNGARVNPMKKHQKGGGDQFAQSLKLCCISPSAVLIKKTLLDSVGTFREDYPVCEDYDLWLKITAKYPVGFVSNPIIQKYGGHEDQLSRKHVAMDYYRIKSIDWILTNGDLEAEKRKLAIDELKKKAKILIKGYEKHNNLENLAEIKSISQQY